MKKIALLLIALMIISVEFFSGCYEQKSTENEKGIDNTPDIPYIPEIPKKYTVKYKVTGSAESVSVTYANYDGGTSQLSRVYLPWERTLLFMKSGDFVYISAQNMGEYGSVTTEIYIDEVLFKKSTSFGAYVIATSSGII